MYTLTGLANWAKLRQDNAYEDKFSIDLSLVEPEQVAKAKQLGLKLKQENKPDGQRGTYVTLWTHAKYKDGKEKTLKVVDSNLNPFSDNIGNGSYVMCEFRMADWAFKNKKGTRADLQAVQVIDLVNFTPKAKPGQSFKPLQKKAVGMGSSPSQSFDLSSEDQTFETIGDEVV